MTNMMRKKRWNVTRMLEYGKFCGWGVLKHLVEAVEIGLRDPLPSQNHVLIKDAYEKAEARALIATTFETGARISEVLRLTPRSFQVVSSPEEAVVVTLTLSKRYRKKSRVAKYKATDGSAMRWLTEEKALRSGRPYEEYLGWLTEPVLAIRRVEIPFSRENPEVSEPLARVMMAWVDYKSQKNPDEKLFFDYILDEKNREARAYRICRAAGEAIGEEFPPHRLRAERATYLATECELTSDELQEWFAWQSPTMSKRYTTLKPIIKRKLWKKTW